MPYIQQVLDQVNQCFHVVNVAFAHALIFHVVNVAFAHALISYVKHWLTCSSTCWV